MKDKFFGNCVLWKKGEMERRRRKVEGRDYEPKQVREAKAKARRKEEDEAKWQRKLSRQVGQDQ